ncbi:serine hydrolase domain-containing protein [Winogradskyella poriferorum]|uniref:serine hydrolase domain-containing protein n=1 Tax=Winogradskyella poriferorum TaxID=307627 RepID=UPI003D645A48
MKYFLSHILCLSSFILIAQLPIDKIDTLVNSKVNYDAPGIMIGIVKDGKVIYERYRGLANLEHQVEVNEKTRSNIASTAKQFTALMLLQLEMEGKLSLEDDIRTYLPNLFKTVDDDIKIRHVINHTSGIRDYVELFDLSGDVWWKRVGLDNDDVIELLEKQEDLGFKPGSRYVYSNSGYVILAKIIEKISGQKFTDYSDAFFQSLGMDETSFIKRYMGVIPNKAAPYSDWGYGEIFHSISVTKTAGEGFLYTTLKDQLKFEMAIQNANLNGNTLLINSQKPIPNSEITDYGFGLKLDDRLGRTAVHHDGVTNAYHAQALRFPAEKLSIFIMSNNGNIRSDLLADEIASLILPPLESVTNYDTNYFEDTTSTSNIEILGQYYTKSGFLTRIEKQEDKIYFKQGNYLSLELIPENSSTFYFAGNTSEKLRFYNDKMIIYYASGAAPVYTKVDVPQASFEDIESFVGTYTNSELNLRFEFKLNEDGNLISQFSDQEGVLDVSIFNNVDLLVGDSYYIKVIRDRFNRITELKLSYGRAKNISFKKVDNLKFHPKVETENGSIQVSTIGSVNGDSSDILLTKNYPNGNEIWSRRIGGSSYDTASSIISTKDGYLIIGSTSSFGEGNYDFYVIKTDKSGKKLWENTYGKFYNDYGYTAEITVEGYRIKGTTQNCPNNTDINRTCVTNIWFVDIDKSGNELSNSVLEELD